MGDGKVNLCRINMESVNCKIRSTNLKIDWVEIMTFRFGGKFQSLSMDCDWQGTGSNDRKSLDQDGQWVLGVSK